MTIHSSRAGRSARAEDERADAERVAEGEQAVAGDHGDRGVRALDPLVHVRDGLEDLVGVELDARDLRLQLGGEHVEQQLGVARRVHVPAVDVEQVVGELTRVREVAVVHEDDAVGRVDVERLRLLLAGCGALRGVAHVAEAHLAEQRAHVAGAERLAHLALGLVDVEDAVALGGGDARGVLAAVLQQQQGVVDLLVDRFR